MKKSKILLFLLLFLFIPKVNAGTLPNWATDVSKLQNARIYSCYSTGCSSLTLQTAMISDDIWAISNYNDLDDIGSYGLGVANYVGILDTDTLYSYSLYLCSTKGLGSTTKEFYTNSASTNGYYGASPTYEKVSYVSMNAEPISTETQTQSCNYAYAITGFLVPSQSNGFISTHFRSSSGISDVGLLVIGYKLEALGNYGGLSTSDIEEVIANSNLATATSIEEVQTSVEEVKTELQELNNEQAETNDLLSNDNVDESTSEAESFFSGFETDTFGLTSVITAPLNLIASITNSSCSPLGLEVPFVNKTMNLPCLSSIYEEFFGSFLDIYQTITFGIVAYWVCVKIFNLVKDFKNPDHDEIEVLDL